MRSKKNLLFDNRRKSATLASTSNVAERLLSMVVPVDDGSNIDFDEL